MEHDLRLGGTALVLRDGAAGLEVLMIRRPSRGTFAGAWVFPGGVVEPEDRVGAADDRESARRAAIRETEEEVGLRISGLVPLSRWTPPAERPKRVRTWFFLAGTHDGEIVPSPDEVVDWAWIRPADALARHAADEMLIVQPTWVTLHGLLTASDVVGAVAAATEPQIFDTVRLPGIGSVWAGDRQHPDGGDGVHRLEQMTLPWVYRRE